MADVSSSVALTGANQAALTGLATYQGFSLRETSGSTAATIRIWDNTAANGTLLDTVKLNPGESAREYYAFGIQAIKGVYVEAVAGSFEGSVRVC